MKIGYCTWGMPKVPAGVFIPYLAELGYDGVEIAVLPGYATELSTLDSAARRRIAQQLRDHGLEIPAIAAHSDMLDLNEDKQRADMRRLKGAVDLAVDWALDGQPPSIDTTSGATSLPWDQAKLLLAERTAELVKYAAAKGVAIAMEPHISTAINTPQRMLELLDLVKSPYLKINFDISHFNVQGISIEESVSLMAPHTVHTHVKDERGRVPNYEFLIPGEGEFDYVRYLKAMRAQGYTGHITAEISVVVQRRPNYDALAVAAQTYRTLARAFDEAGMDRVRHSHR